MDVSAAITVTPILVADLMVEGEVMPVCVHVIDHPDARVLVDTEMTELHPAVVAAFQPLLYPSSKQEFDVASVDIVVNTHLHADHCGGNIRFADKPIYVQRRELDDARSKDDYTVREWVNAPGLQYVPLDGELDLIPGIRAHPSARSHTRDTGRGGGDRRAYEPRTVGQRQSVRSIPRWFGSRTSPSRGDPASPPPKLRARPSSKTAYVGRPPERSDQCLRSWHASGRSALGELGEMCVYCVLWLD